jgi:hypothetical protein
VTKAEQSLRVKLLNPNIVGMHVREHLHCNLLRRMGETHRGQPAKASPNRVDLHLRGRPPPSPRQGRGGDAARFAADSPLEGTGFELLVRGRGEAGCRAF